MERTVAAITAEGGQLEVVTAKVMGRDMKLFKAAPPTMREYFMAFFAQQSAKEFLVYDTERLRFGEVYAKVLRIAAALRHRYGIAKGDPVAIAMRTYHQRVIK